MKAVGDLLIIDGREWPSKISGPRQKLIEVIKRHGFEQAMEEVAYTWFNRFAALRFMEIHDYLDHGWRALSSRDGGLPEILAHASDVALQGLNAAKIIEMQLAGNRDDELYRMLLVAQCNTLSRVMPFLFERIDDLTELLLPDNLLRTDSILSKLVSGIPEEDWQEIEVIGWLYQFYISEKKDQVIGKVVKSEDIPAATQLFTPNWIVQYLVQNSVGRLWLMANPQSGLAQKWPYYIKPAEQTPEVQAQLDARIQTRIREDGDAINPETITVLDPACGSGHILVVAYDVLKAIYLERGYQPRSIPRLILEKNLYGLDIDDRAAQMAGFALLMKARADDRSLFTAADVAGTLQPPKLNVLSLQESKVLSADELATHLAPFKVQRATITALLETFEHSKTFGSLIQIPYALKTHLVLLTEVLALVKQSGDMYAIAAADDLLPLVQQARVLSMQFDAVVANPPYIGAKYMPVELKSFLKAHFDGFEKDAFSAFMVRCLSFSRLDGHLGFMSPFVWMFIASHEQLRIKFINSATLTSLIQLEYNASGDVRVPLCLFTLARKNLKSYFGSFVRLSDFPGQEVQEKKTLEAISNKDCGWFFVRNVDDFERIPGYPIAYWLGNQAIKAFRNNKRIADVAVPRKGMATGDNNRFVRMWTEVSRLSIGLDLTREGAKVSNFRWFPYANGGGFHKWFGMLEDVVLWENDGEVLQRELHPNGNVRAVGLNLDYIFSQGVTWSPITSALFSSRLLPGGALFSSASNTLFSKKINSYALMAQLNSCVFEYFSKIINPTLNLNTGDVANIPVIDDEEVCRQLEKLAKQLIEISKDDWDSNELSLNFANAPLLKNCHSNIKVSDVWMSRSNFVALEISNVLLLERRVNELVIGAYGLQNDLSPEVPEVQINLARADREKDCQRLISYAIGCMMGRYSLDEPGLIYAHAGNVGVEPGRYATFPADADGIVPITDELWFADDAGSRIREFLRAAWGPDTLEENMAWLAESLGQKPTETPDEAIRRYIADKFFKDHLQTYKKRPIYWLFKSGKQGAFQALVYLHRYSEGTIARMRTDYIVPLISKIAYRLEMLAKDSNTSSSPAARTKIQKQAEALRKKQTELLAFDEKLRHFADMRIALDLDDGVKSNYAKFGDLLAESKAITGGTDE